MSEFISYCPDCSEVIDPEHCWCGENMPHGPTLTHTARPLGCECPQ